MDLPAGRLKPAAILLLLAGCAYPPPPARAVATVPPAPSPLALRNEWLKGYQAGLNDGRREQARRDQARLAPSTPPPPGSQPAADAPEAPAPIVAPIQTPAQSVFVPAGPAEPVSANP